MAGGFIHKAVPRQVLDEIKTKVREGSNKGEGAWRAASNTEDTITGHWGASLVQDWSEPINAEEYLWRFRIEYRKFSGSTEETATGSDGIFQIEVERFDIGVTPLENSLVRPEVIETADTFKKGILFQSKRFDNTKRKEMVKQLKNIESISPNEGAYFEYGPDAFRAAPAACVVDVDGFTKQIQESDFHRLGDFLADEFLECKRGVEGMYFDFDKEVLYFPKDSVDIARVRLAIKHGFRVRVKALRMVPFRNMSEQSNW